MRRENYDVVVIGSGMGGMCAAALLTQEGYKTLVVERLPRIGGRFSTIEHEGFKLTTGAIVVEMGGLIEQIFGGVGAKFEVNPVPAHWRIGGKDYELPPRKGVLRALISLASGDERETEGVMSAIRRSLSWQEPSNSISLREWLLQYTQDEKILGIFWALVNVRIGVNDNELPAGEFFHFLSSSSRASGFAPKGNLALMESLARAIKAKGSEVWTGCQARQIIVADGVVKGVIIQKGGDEVGVMAKAVISNAGPEKTVELAGKQSFDRGYLEQLKETLKPVPHFLIQAASDRPLMECPSLILTGTRRVSFIVCPTIVCPELAPKGKHLLVSCGAPYSFLPPYDFKREKELHIQDLRDSLPGFDEHAQVLVATYFREEWPLYRSWPGSNLPQKTSVENLYNVGDGVLPSGGNGLGGCAKSAQIVVEDIKLRFKPGEA